MIDLFYEYTEDKLRLQGTYFDSGRLDYCVLFIHGQAQSILDNYFAYVLGKNLSNNGISFLYSHNRGYSYINCMSKKDSTLEMNGATFEIFEDSLKDIEVWITKIKSLGYKKIILMGHSLGCNKALYYLSKNNNCVQGLVLASAPDMVGITKKEESEFDNLLNEAKNNVKNGNPRQLLKNLIGGTDYISSATFISESLENSNIDNFPIERNPETFEQLSVINIPILSFAGSNEYPTYLKQHVLKEKAINCDNFEYQIIDNTNHFYNNKEEEISKILLKWINKNLK
ncbi:MAG: alpha/beta fold hydrolase [Bacilli bacterium]|nr:alpha/beta fold hydrolase [Bacilli bacterium]